ncbi:VMAP-C domain-containing protein [Halostreptopolyspora alba]|uniref:Serine protease n=1 Tax=Halostreptopolyspora alba TaxID=2487137 RepID=A0A3N0EFC6_9ACTN|nr:hypothetical protein EFW17_04490 [Nocardiopsaceae bacterium YIM 96095]
MEPAESQSSQMTVPRPRTTEESDRATVASPFPALPPTWQVRITGPDGTVAGGGVLVPGSRVLTCVHVVDQALGRGHGSHPPGPEDVVYVDVPHHVQYPHTSARVIDTSWNSERDTTLLRLGDHPWQGVPAPARLSSRTSEILASRHPYPVRVQGYPRSTPDGLSATARVVGLGGDLPQRAQVDIDPRQPVRFEPGFSGCGVLDTSDGSVIGILTSALQDAPDNAGRLSDRHGRIGLMEPVEMVEALREHTADPELEEVRGLLSDMLFEAAWEPYGAATRHRATERVRFHSAWEAFAYLRDLTPRPDGLPCEVVFVEEIARSGKGAAASRVLRSYSDSRHPSEVPRQALARLRADSVPERPETAVLIVSVEPVPGDSDYPRGYLVSHWLRDGYGTDKGTPFRMSENGLREALLRLIDEAEARLPARAGDTELRLELVLPFALLTEPVAQWRLSAPLTGEGERLGASYEIVLHAYERVNDPGWERARRKLQRSWRELVDNGEGRVHLIEPGPAAETGARLSDQLNGPGIVLCVLGVAAESADGGRQLAVALQAGLPAIAWLRGEDERRTRGFHDRMTEIVHGGGGDTTICAQDLVSLPRQLREWRTQSGQPTNEEHDPYDIIILLDNMDQMRELQQIGILASPKPGSRRD